MEDWVEVELSTLELGDKRLDKRSKKILSKLSERPQESIPEIFCTGAEMHACYRFLNNDLVTPKKLLEPHIKATIKRIQKHSVVLLPSDSTSFDFSSRPGMEGLGRLSGDNLGIWLHPTLAVTPDRTCLGVVAAKIWTRPLEKQKKSKTETKNKPVKEKENYRWIESFFSSCDIQELAPNTQIINITDREGDFVELFLEIQEGKQNGLPTADVIIRSCHDRCLDEKDDNSGKFKKLRKTLLDSPTRGEITYTVSQTENRKKREVTQSLKAAKVTFKEKQVKGTRFKKVTINAVMAIEENPPEGEEPIMWILLTTLPIDAFEDIKKVIEYYLCRWDIEVLFKVLKSGCKVEERQLQGAENLTNLLALFMIFAWRLMYIMMMGRNCPDMPCNLIFEEAEWKSVYRIVSKREVPDVPPKLSEFIVMVGILGGYTNRKNDPPPGPKIMWKGISRMHDLALAWTMFGPGAT